MSDQFFSDKNYKYLNPAEKSRLWHICKKRTGNDSKPSPPPLSINQVKRKISELKVILRDLERGMNPNDDHDLLGENDDNIKPTQATLNLIGRRPVGRGARTEGYDLLAHPTLSVLWLM